MDIVSLSTPSRKGNIPHNSIARPVVIDRTTTRELVPFGNDYRGADKEALALVLRAIDGEPVHGIKAALAAAGIGLDDFGLRYVCLRLYVEEGTLLETLAGFVFDHYGTVRLTGLGEDLIAEIEEAWGVAA